MRGIRSERCMWKRINEKNGLRIKTILVRQAILIYTSAIVVCKAPGSSEK